MNRNELIQHIYEEIQDMIQSRSYSNENDVRYYTRRSEGLLDMILGFLDYPPDKPQEEKKNE